MKRGDESGQCTRMKLPSLGALSYGFRFLQYVIEYSIKSEVKTAAFFFSTVAHRHNSTLLLKKLSACRATLLGICQPPSPSGEKKGSRPCIGSMQRVARG